MKDRYVIDNKITIENPINYEIVYKNIEPLKIKSKEWLSQVSNFSQTGMVVERVIPLFANNELRKVA